MSLMKAMQSSDSAKLGSGAAASAKATGTATTQVKQVSQIIPKEFPLNPAITSLASPKATTAVQSQNLTALNNKSA